MSASHIKDLMLQQGLILIGFADLKEEPRFYDFKDWLEKGLHAGMKFLENNLSCRKSPTQLMDGSIQAILFAFPYYQGDKLNLVKKTSYNIAQYARMRDYHKEMRRRASIVLNELKHIYPELEGRITIDSAPLLERALAERSGSGFIGKNTCYIDPKQGSFFLLGEIIINKSLGQEAPKVSLEPGVRTKAGGCGTCKRCQTHCPTGALDSDYKLDANKCIAYWTIEHRGPIPKEFWPWIKLYIFGCDICQLACPYNRPAVPKLELARYPRSFSQEEIYEIAVMDQPTYERIFGGSPMTRAKRDGLRRNALIAMYEDKHPRLQEALEKIAEDESEVLKQTLQAVRDALR